MILFVDGPGGSGKTSLYNCLIHYLRSHGRKVMTFAMTGIASNLLPEGQTARKTFCIPVPCLETTNCYVKPSSAYAQLLMETLLFIIDEASRLSMHQLEAIGRMLRDIREFTQRQEYDYVNGCLKGLGLIVIVIVIVSLNVGLR